MFFLDSAGFFALVSLFIQCITAWTFFGLFASLHTGRTPWGTRWHAAFAGLAVALSALSLRFLLAHYHIADVAIVADGSLLTRVFQALYLGGKIVFLGFVVAGIAAVRQRPVPWMRAMPWGVALGALVGYALPSVESALAVQLLPLTAGFLCAAHWLDRRPDEAPSLGNSLVAFVLRAWSLIWCIYAICVVQIASTGPDAHALWSVPLRVNPLVDLAMQVLLGTGLLMIVLHEVQRATISANRERDRLREQVQRDDRMRALSTLVGGVAHEINNPLTAILGYAEELDHADLQVRREAAQVIREQADRCRHIVQRLSELGRRAPLDDQFVDVVQLAARVVRGFQPQCAEAGVTLQVEAPTAAVVLRADPTALEQVLANLVANALHVAPRGSGVQVQVTATTSQVQLSVADAGPGVPSAVRERIFEAFWTTKPAGEGTGLGLAVAAALVRAHRGQIDVAASPAGGALFTVSLPREEASQSTEPARESVPEPVVAEVPGPQLRLLVVDDDEAVRWTIARRARVDGWSVEDVPSAEDALDALAEHRFDAVVCDLRMPGMGGVGLHDQLRERAPSLLRRVLFVSGDLTSPESARFAARPAVQLLAKPFTHEELFDRLRDVVRDQGRNAEPLLSKVVRQSPSRSDTPARSS